MSNVQMCSRCNGICLHCKIAVDKEKLEELIKKYLENTSEYNKMILEKFLRGD